MKVYYDTNILIDYCGWRYFNKNIDTNTLNIFERGLKGDYDILISYLSIMELQSHFSNENISKKMIDIVVKDIKNAKDISYVEIKNMNKNYFTELVPYIRNNIDVTDAMHLRTAQDCECKYFITYDKKLLDKTTYFMERKIFEIGFFILDVDGFNKILEKEKQDQVIYEGDTIKETILDHYTTEGWNSFTIIDRDMIEYDAVFEKNGKKYAIDIKYNTVSKIPNSIIQEIINRDIKGIDKIILVSPLGFSEEAKDFANKHNEKIELKLMSEFYEEFSTNMKDFQLIDIPITEKIDSDKIKLKKIWDELPNLKKEEKGKKLENWTECMFKCISGFKIKYRDIRTDVEEIDFIISNESRDTFWLKRNDPILVECKNWSKPVGSEEIKKFSSTLEDRNLSDGIFITMNGISGNEYKDAHRAIINKRIKGYHILVLDNNDLKNISECADPTDVLKEKYYDLFK